MIETGEFRRSPSLEVAEGAFGLAQVLVAERDLLGGQVGVGAGEQVLAVQALLGRDLLAVDQEPAGRGLAQIAREGRVVAAPLPGPVLTGS
jgi:hypothetical protein